MNAKKKIISLAMAASLAAVAVAGSSLAYFTDKDQKENTYTVGNVDIVLTEKAWDNGGQKEAEDMYPGEAVAKDPTVTNNGANPAFIRIKVEKPEEISFRYQYVAGINKDWVEHEGYYYYMGNGTDTNATLDADESTAPLFDQMVLSADATNTTEGGNVKVFAEAVQAQGAKASYSDIEKMTVAEIAAWFTTCMGE